MLTRPTWIREEDDVAVVPGVPSAQHRQIDAGLVLAVLDRSEEFRVQAGDAGELLRIDTVILGVTLEDEADSWAPGSRDPVGEARG